MGQLYELGGSLCSASLRNSVTLRSMSPTLWAGRKGSLRRPRGSLHDEWLVRQSHW